MFSKQVLIPDNTVVIYINHNGSSQGECGFCDKLVHYS